MDLLPAILALLTATAGWFYMFHSKAAEGLADVEERRLNLRRVRLRRVGGFVMICLGVMLYLGFHAADAEARPRVFLAVWLGVMLLLAVVVLLALIDVRLTLRLRHRQRLAGGSRASNRGPDVDPRPPH